MTIRIYLVTRKLIDLPKVTAQVDKKNNNKICSSYNSQFILFKYYLLKTNQYHFMNAGEITMRNTRK